MLLLLLNFGSPLYPCTSDRFHPCSALQFGSFGVPGADMLRVYVVVADERMASSSRGDEAALAQLISEAIITETMVWIKTGQVCASFLAVCQQAKPAPMCVMHSVSRGGSVPKQDAKAT